MAGPVARTRPSGSFGRRRRTDCAEVHAHASAGLTDLTEVDALVSSGARVRSLSVMDEAPRQPSGGTSSGRRWQSLTSLALDALRTFRWGNEAPGVALVARAWRAGALGRVGLAALIAGVASASVLLTSQGGPPRPLAPGSLVAVVALLLIATALGLAAARALALPLYVVTALAMGWYGVLPAGGVAGTPLFALPPLALLALGWVIARVRRTASGRWWLLPLALGAGWVARGALGLSFVEPVPDTVAGVLLGLILWGLVTNPRALAFERAMPGSNGVFWLALAAFGVPWIVGASMQPAATADRLVLLGRALLLPLDLFWLWLGATTFQGAIEVAEWSVRTSVRIVGAKIVTIGLPVVWVVAALFAWLSTWMLPPSVAVFAHDLGVAAWAESWSDALWYAVRWQVWVTLATFVLLLVLRMRGRRGATLVGAVHGLWLAAFLGVLGLWGAAEDAVAAADDAVPATAWAGVMLVGGLVWEVARSSGAWVDTSPARLLGVLAGLMAVLATVVATLGARVPDLLVEYGFYGFLGVVVLGLPLVLADLLAPGQQLGGLRSAPGQEAESALPGGKLVALGLIGAASASLTLGVDAYAGPVLALGPLLWALVLLGAGRSLGVAQSPRSLATAGAALGVGFGVFWLSPEALPIPLFDAWQARYLDLDLARPVFDLGAFLFPLFTLCVGLVLGLALARVPRRWLIVPIALASIAMASLAPRLPDLPSGPPTLTSSTLPACVLFGRNGGTEAICDTYRADGVVPWASRG